LFSQNENGMFDIKPNERLVLAGIGVVIFCGWAESIFVSIIGNCVPANKMTQQLRKSAG